MPFDPNKPFTAVSSGFDPEKPFVKKEEVGPVEAGLKGAAQELTFGFSDEIIAAAKSAFGPETYEQELEKAQKELESLEGRDAYEVGKWLGFAGSLAVPGAALAKVPAVAKIGKAAAKGAKTAGKAAATVGTVYGAVAHPGITLPLLAARYGKKIAAGMSKLLKGESEDVVKGAADILRKGGKQADDLAAKIDKGDLAGAKKAIIDPFKVQKKRVKPKPEPAHIDRARAKEQRKQDLATVLKVVKPDSQE